MKTWKKWTYGWGNFANTVAQQVFNNRIQFYYIDVLGLNAALAGVIWFFFGLWNAINDPLLGNLSDRTRTRLGRRVPYILFGAIPLGLSFFCKSDTLLSVTPCDSSAAMYFSGSLLKTSIQLLQQK